MRMSTKLGRKSECFLCEKRSVTRYHFRGTIADGDDCLKDGCNFSGRDRGKGSPGSWDLIYTAGNIAGVLGG